MTPSGTKIVHTVPDLAEYAEVPESELAPVLEALAAARILRPVDPAPGETTPRFEIFHDVLAPAILDWRAAHERAGPRVRRRRGCGRYGGGSRRAGAECCCSSSSSPGSQSGRSQQQREAQRQAEVARSQALAASRRVAARRRSRARPPARNRGRGRGKRTREAEDALRRALTSSRLRAVVPRPRPVRSVAISPDDSRLLTVDGLGNAHVRSAQPAAPTWPRSAPASSTTRPSIGEGG